MCKRFDELHDELHDDDIVESNSYKVSALRRTSSLSNQDEQEGSRMQRKTEESETFEIAIESLRKEVSFLKKDIDQKNDIIAHLLSLTNSKQVYRQVIDEDDEELDDDGRHDVFLMTPPENEDEGSQDSTLELLERLLNDGTEDGNEEKSNDTCDGTNIETETEIISPDKSRRSEEDFEHPYCSDRSAHSA